MRNGCIVPIRLALLGTALVSLGFAQMMGGNGMMGSGSSGTGTPGTNAGMGGGMMGSGASGTSGTDAGMSGGMGSGMQGGISGMGAGMGTMSSGPVVGTDGTAYVVRTATVTTGTRQTAKRELLAVNPSSGKANWTLQIDGTMISEPVLARDGTILLTTSEPDMASNSTAQPALLIVAPAATSARVQARVPIDADMLSAPVMTADGQTIYAIAVDMPGMSGGNQTASAGSTYLYAFYPGTGALKFKVQLR